MTIMRHRALLAACLLAAAPLATGASAQTGSNYAVKTMNFDLWCQETAGLPPDRCDKRTTQDEATFEAYRAKIEQYEIPYLQQKNKDAQLDADILHNDPVDRSPAHDNQTQRQDTGQSSPVPHGTPQ